MILTLIAVGLIVIGIGLIFLSEKFIYSDDLLFGIGLFGLAIGIITGLTIIVTSIGNHVGVDKDIRNAELEYNSIVKQLEIIDSEYEDVSKAEVIKQAYDWNVDVYDAKYWTESPWTNWLYSKKYADSLKYIEEGRLNDIRD